MYIYAEIYVCVFRPRPPPVDSMREGGDLFDVRGDAVGAFVEDDELGAVVEQPRCRSVQISHVG